MDPKEVTTGTSVGLTVLMGLTATPQVWPEN